MTNRPRSHILLTLGAFAIVIAAAGLFSCSSIRNYYRPHRPDGNMREIGRAYPAQPQHSKLSMDKVADFEIPASPISIAVAPGVLYLSAASYGFATVDFSDPTAHRVANSVQGIIAPKDPRSRFFLSVLPDPDNKRIFVLDRLQGLCLWDASDPLSPVLQRKLELGQSVNAQALTMRKIGDYYYLASGGGGLIRIGEKLDDAPEIEPLLVAFDHTRDVTFFPPHWLLVADGHDSGMQIVDISEEKHPRLAHVFNVMTYCDQVVPLKDYAIMASRGLGLVAIDMRDPSQPFLSRFYLPPPDCEVKATALWRGRYLIVGGKTSPQGRMSTGYMQIYDMQNPADAALEMSLPMEAEINAMALSGDYLVANLWEKKRMAVYHLTEK